MPEFTLAFGLLALVGLARLINKPIDIYEETLDILDHRDYLTKSKALQEVAKSKEENQ